MTANNDAALVRDKCGWCRKRKATHHGWCARCWGGLWTGLRWPEQL